MTARRITEQAADRAAAPGWPAAPLPQTAARLADRLREHFTRPPCRFSRCSRWPRKPGSSPPPTGGGPGWPAAPAPGTTWTAELADVVITAYVTAARARHRPGRRHPRQDRRRVHPRLARAPARRLTRPPGNHTPEGTPVMANEPTTTITGNLTADPELRFTPTGRPVAAFTIANTPRFPDRQTGEWQDGETWFVRCSAWGDTAENIATSLAKGNAVVATGRLRCRTWEDKDTGAKRAAVEMTVDDIGPSLRRAVAKVTKATREHAPANGDGNGAAEDQWSTPAPAAAPAGSDDLNPPF